MVFDECIVPGDVRMHKSCLCLTVAGVLGVVCAAWAKESQPVTVSYVVAPPRALPEGLHAVAVINSGVASQGLRQDEREARWSVMAADMIEAMLQAGGAMSDSPLAVAKRSETQAVLREHDLALAGMVAGAQATTAGKLLAVQGLITSRITISIDEQRGTKSTIDWMSIMGGAVKETFGNGHEAVPVAPAPRERAVVRPRTQRQVVRGPDGRRYVVERQSSPRVVSPRYRGSAERVYAPRVRAVPQRERTVAGGGLALHTREVEEISRHLTVQCSFTLIDVGTGRAMLQYSPPPARKQDRKSPDFLFGGLFGEGDLDPVDHFIGELVEQSTREFVSMLVPVEMSYTYEVTANEDAAEEGLRALRAGDDAAAMRHFQRELEEEGAEHETLFALGVTCELLGEPRQALQFYARALAAEDVDEEELAMYTAARDRLAGHIDRIITPADATTAGTSQHGPQWLIPETPAETPTETPAAEPEGDDKPATLSPADADTAEPAQVPAPIVEESVSPR